MVFVAVNANTIEFKEPSRSGSQGAQGHLVSSPTPKTTSKYLSRSRACSTGSSAGSSTAGVDNEGRKRSAAVVTEGAERAPLAKRFMVDGVNNDHSAVAMPSPEPSDRTHGMEWENNDNFTSHNAQRNRPTACSHGENDVSKADFDALSTSKTISVYASATSMSALDSTFVQTACDLARAYSGQSLTLYHEAHRNPASTIDCSSFEPFLNSNPHRNSSDAWNARKSCSTQSGSDAVQKTGAHSKRHERAIGSPSRAGGTANSWNAKVALPSPSTTPRARTNSSCDFEYFSQADEQEMTAVGRSVEEAVEPQQYMPPVRNRAKNMRDVDEYEDYGGTLWTDEERKEIRELKLKREALHLPIIRKRCTRPIMDRSPIFGASRTALLRTCFRVGEAINTCSQALRCGDNVILELYARVTSSWREEEHGRKQHFIFIDLYHDKPPHLKGTYELWAQAELWNADSKAFLAATDQGMMCRVLAKMRRNQQTKWKLDVLSVWETGWDDVDHVSHVYSEDLICRERG